MELSKEQQKNFSYAEYIILVKQEVNGKKAYTKRYLGIDTKLDKNGVLHAYFGDEVVYIAEKGSDEEEFMPLTEDASSKSERRYTTKSILSQKDIFTGESKLVKLQVVVNDKYPNGIVRSAVSLEEEDLQMPDKQLIDIGDYQDIIIVDSRARYVTKEESGQLKPFDEWEDSGAIMGVDIWIENGLELRVHNIDNPQDYACMFYIYDTQGNCTVSELLPLE